MTEPAFCSARNRPSTAAFASARTHARGWESVTETPVSAAARISAGVEDAEDDAVSAQTARPTAIDNAAKRAFLKARAFEPRSFPAWNREENASTRSRVSAPRGASG